MIKRKMLLWEKKAFLDGASLILGLDEAGRGPLAGPVIAAAVLLKPSPLKRFTFPRYAERLDDSKKLSFAQRERSYREILKKSLFGVGLKDPRFIDRQNIRIATLLAMKEAVEKVVTKYCRLNNKLEARIRDSICVLVDGDCDPDVPYRKIPIIKGDSRSVSIAAASIVAKVTRDRMMVSYDKRYPGYGFSRHKGYGTRFHIETIQKRGPCPIHRKSFARVKIK
ncbi:ribonuclease HII [Candidatus Omnitrophota bacterium]